ncbi:MAG: hypothetical protein AAF658_22795, partial [Myxococcota bacterium]
MHVLPLLIALATPLEDGLSRVEELASDREWLRLLHFENGESIVDGPDFFLAEDGATNAASELRATLRALYAKPEDGKMPTHCRFPARALYLSRALE